MPLSFLVDVEVIVLRDRRLLLLRGDQGVLVGDRLVPRFFHLAQALVARFDAGMLGVLVFFRDDALEQPGRCHVVRVDAENALESRLSLVVLAGAAELLGLGEEIIDLIEVLDEAGGDRGVTEQMGVVGIVDRVGDLFLLVQGILVVGIVR